jgi:hypothetical protein
LDKKFKGRKEKKVNPIESPEQYGLMQAVAHGTARVKGISKSVAKEFIKKTPAAVRSKFARAIKKNPSLSQMFGATRNPDTVDDAEELSREWHGRDNETVTEIEEIETYPENLAELADLEELGVLSADLVGRYQICFKKDRPKLCAPDGRNLEIVGGDQSLSEVPEGIDYQGKKLVPLGYLVSIVYETDKHHLEGSNGYPESYEHYFGEEFYKENAPDMDEFRTPDDWFEEMLEDGLVEEAIAEGLIPTLAYNQTDQKLLIVGGRYTVEDVGIKN